MENNGHPQVTATMAGGDKIILTISDNGCGIPEEDIKRIFEPFFSTKTGKGGTGLGLAISREFVQLMGGDISVSSEVGQGATFIFEIECAPESDGEAMTESAKRVVALAPGQPIYRMLVVDDAPHNRQLLLKLLTQLKLSYQ